MKGVKMDKKIDKQLLKEEIKEEVKEELIQDAEESIKEELGVTRLPDASRGESSVANFLDKHVEPRMWSVKFAAIIVVFVSLIVSVGLMLYGAYEATHLFGALFHAAPAKEIQLLTLGVVDMFLFGMVMMIFSFASYNLFISKLDNVTRDTRSSEIRPKWVKVENFGELKTIFIKVVEMILIITFLELVVTNTELFKGNIFSLLIIPAGIVMIAYSLKLLHSDEEHK
jgi:uncharacterized membrane protein YqhA